ncbi:MAG: UDP-N-acetylmuramoyl-L-alanine--D-glutamate ligase [Erysipelotrichaceae bacterium]|nr:UDP-N-acetylmuramoyl-L-alanine--D-glutamate ligase [Bacillota bacterium]
MLNELVNEFRNKKVLIWGLGMEGNSTYTFIKNCLPDQKLYVCDTKIVNTSVFKDDIIVDEKTLDTTEYDIVMKAPGIKGDNLKGNISGQAPLFLKYFGKNVIGITGTKGKSTTTTLIYDVLKTKFSSIYMVGNMGLPCFDIIKHMKKDSVIVFELSCHQLQFTKYSPYVGVLLNLYEEHLDHYDSYENYKTAKKQIYLHQSYSDEAIINYDLKDEIEDRDNIAWINKDIYAKDKTLINPYDSVELESTNLIGSHNMSNLSVVYYITHVLYGVTNEDFIEVIKNFNPLPHRLEIVGNFNGITYVNDSISTIGQSTIQAIKGLKNVNTVLIGGYERNIDYTDLIEFLKTSNIENIILMYDTGKRIFRELIDINSTVYYEKNLYDAMKLAKRVTKRNTTCLLSPAAASYNDFKNFEERGNEFKRLARII